VRRFFSGIVPLRRTGCGLRRDAPTCSWKKGGEPLAETQGKLARDSSRPAADLSKTLSDLSHTLRHPRTPSSRTTMIPQERGIAAPDPQAQRQVRNYRRGRHLRLFVPRGGRSVFDTPGAGHTLWKAVSEALREEFFVAERTHSALTEAPATFTKGERIYPRTSPGSSALRVVRQKLSEANNRYSRIPEAILSSYPQSERPNIDELFDKFQKWL